MTNKFIKNMWEAYGEEVENETPRFEKLIEDLRSKAIQVHPFIRKAKDGKAAGTVNVNDFKILYPLIRTFKPKFIFEIGTWVGTSSMIMAEAILKNNDGGKIYTCDTNTFYSLPESYNNVIHTINAFSSEALDSLPANVKFDLVFVDGSLDKASVSKLLARSHKRTVFAFHDYSRPDKKGVLNMISFQKQLRFTHSKYLARATISNQIIDSTIAILVPPALIDEMNLPQNFHLLNVLNIYYLEITSFVWRVVRKIIGAN